MGAIRPERVRQSLPHPLPGEEQRGRDLVAYHKDLLDLRKPYGVHILKPRAFVEALIAGS
jgi:hypothetical protein